MQITPEETNPDAGRNQHHLAFMIGGEEYAVSLLKVNKITEYDTDTEILRTLEWIRRMSGASGNSAEKNGPENKPSHLAIAPKKTNRSALERNFTSF
jgi:hypothetical protein